MFWQSVGQGIVSFTDWHIIVGAIGVSLCSLLHVFIGGTIMGDNDSKAKTGAGCLMMLLGGPILQAFGVSCFILICLPAIIGQGGFTPTELIGPMFWPVLKEGIVALIIVLILCVIPIVGGFIADIPGVAVFLQGILILRAVTEGIFLGITGGGKIPASVFPSFWQCVGYVVIGLLICWIVFMALAFVSDMIKKKTDPVGHMMDQYSSQSSGTMMIVGLFAGPLFGVLPLLMYGKYVSLALKAA